MDRALSAIRAVSGEWALHPPRFLSFVERIENGQPMQVAPQQQPRIQGGIAVIPMIGEMSARPMLNMQGDAMTTSTMLLDAQFREALRNPAVSAILFDVDSPGGTVYYTDQLSSRIRDARGTKPIIAYGNGVVGSAAFWIASAAERFILAPGADAGSVGVWSVHMDLSGALEKQGIKPTLISSGKYKTEGNPFGPLDPDAMMFMQARTDSMHEEFIQALSRNRGKTASQVRRDFGEGRLFSAREAVSRGMADDVQTVDRVIKSLAGKSGKPRMSVAAAETQEWLAAANVLYQQEVEAEDKVDELVDKLTEVQPGASADLLRRKLELREKHEAPRGKP